MTIAFALKSVADPRRLERRGRLLPRSRLVADPRWVRALHCQTHRLFGAAFSPDEIFTNTQELVSHIETVIPYCLTRCATQRILPARRAASMVHQVGEMALPHRRMEAVA
jgi:hypothetical protein